MRWFNGNNLNRSNRKVIGLVLLCLGIFAVIMQAATMTYVIAHFPYGGGWSTQLWVSNTGAPGTTVELQWFDQSGNPIAVPLQNSQSLLGSVNTVNLTLGTNNTQVVGADVTQRNATGPNGLQVTWALATASGPVNIFSMFDFAGSSVATVVPSSQVSSSVGTQSLVPATSFRFPVVIYSPAGLPRFNAGVAVANPNSSPTTMTAELLNASGGVAGTLQRTIPAHGQVTFVSTDATAFGNILNPNTPFTGALAVCATLPVGMVAIGVEGTEYFTTAVTNDPCP